MVTRELSADARALLVRQLALALASSWRRQQAPQHDDQPQRDQGGTREGAAAGASTPAAAV